MAILISSLVMQTQLTSLSVKKAVRDMTKLGKVFNEMQNIGKAKYVVNFHDGIDTHNDGSPFFGIKIFKNRTKKDNFINSLVADGYRYGKA
jgi:hypothetical protein